MREESRGNPGKGNVSVLPSTVLKKGEAVEEGGRGKILTASLCSQHF